MNKRLLSFPLILCINLLHGQSGTATAGGDVQGGGGSVAWSLGQVAGIVATGPGGSAAQGVQQPYPDFGTTVPGPDPFPVVSVFPTLTNDRVIVVVSDGPTAGLRWELIDVAGGKLTSQGALLARTEVSLVAYAAGPYYLRIYSPDSQLRIVKIIKQPNE